MLRRGALVLLLLFSSGLAALWGAEHFGLKWPWEPAPERAEAPATPQPALEPLPPAATHSTDATPSPDHKTREHAPAAGPDPKAASSSQTREQAEKAAGKALEDTTAALAPDQPGTATPAPGSVALDISRISPEGSSVFAGRAEPDTYVTVMADGKPAGTARADSNGEWSLSTEYKFSSADAAITFETSRTPPPAPEPLPAPAKIAEKATEPAPQSATSAATEALKKFEDLVAEAREEVKKAQEEKARVEQEKARREAEAPPAAAQDRKEAERADNAPAPTPEAAKPEAPRAPAENAARPESTTAPPQTPASEDASPRQGDAASSTADGGAPPSGRTADARDAAPAKSAASTADKGEAQQHQQANAAAATSSAAREAKPQGASVPIPVPIMFVYNEATLTPEGERAAGLLLEYLTLKRLSAVELTGHADERGTYEYNMDLSRERLEAVSARLKKGGYTGELKLIPKGKSEPYSGVDRSRYSGEALYQLDRRVELRVAR